jgi:hypothetical protein
MNDLFYFSMSCRSLRNEEDEESRCNDIFVHPEQMISFPALMLFCLLSVFANFVIVTLKGHNQVKQIDISKIKAP